MGHVASVLILITMMFYYPQYTCLFNTGPLNSYYMLGSAFTSRDIKRDEI